MSLKEYATDSGAALPEINSEFAHIPLSQLAASLTNPRTTFNPERLQELADSIKASGVHQPILVRPLPGARVGDTEREVQFEIVAGERRFRACQIAGVATIPAMVRAMTDGEVLEVQIVENLQRDDLTELEEAEGYERLMAHSTLTAEEVGGKIGKSRSYVYARLKLLDLSLECKDALRQGQIDASRALLIARIPDTQLQLKALEQATKTDWQGSVPSFREFQRWVQHNVMLRLDAARFKITDATLVPAAGSCSDCPKRTGAAPDLFADVDSADVCTDPKCFHEKQALHDEQQLTKAKENGQKIITGAQAKRIWPYEHSDTLNGFKRLDRTDPRIESKKTLKKLLGKDCPEATLLQSPHNGSLIEVVAEEKITQLLKDLGLITPIQARASREISASEAKANAEEKYQRTWRKRAIEQSFEAIKREPDYTIIAGTIIRQLAKMVLRGLVGDDRAHTADLLGVGKVADAEGIKAYIETCTDAEAQGALLLLTMQHDMHFNSYAGIKDPARIMAVADDYQVDLQAIREEVQEQMKAAVKKPAKALATTTLLAQPPALPVAGATPLKPTKAAPRKARLSPEEAQLGIALALQKLEAEPDGSEAVPSGDSAPDQTDRPQVNSVEQAAQEGLAIGQRVRVTEEYEWLALTLRKWAGKEGTVTASEPAVDSGDLLRYTVTFKGRNGGVASFLFVQLKVVPS